MTDAPIAPPTAAAEESPVLTVLLNYKTPELTLKSLRAAIAAMEHTPGEIVVVDNASGDGSYEQIHTAAQSEGWLEDGRVRLIQSPVNGGFGAGMNLGMHAKLSNGARPAFYYLLNSDAFANPETISTLRAFLRETPKAGFAGSYVHGTDGTPHCTAFRFPSIASELEGAAHTGLISRLLPNVSVPMDLPTVPTRVDWTAGASLMIRAEVIEQLGGFDEKFFLYFEETELCNRAAKAGWLTYYVPASRIAHVGSASTGMKHWTRTPGYWFESRWHYFTKVHGRGYAILATLAHLMGCGIYGLRRSLQTKPQMTSNGFVKDLWSHMCRQLVSPAATSNASVLSSDPKEPK